MAKLSLDSSRTAPVETGTAESAGVIKVGPRIGKAPAQAAASESVAETHTVTVIAEASESVVESQTVVVAKIEPATKSMAATKAAPARERRVEAAAEAKASEAAAPAKATAKAPAAPRRPARRETRSPT